MTSSSTAHGTTRAATAVRRKSPLGWVPWVALLLLGIISAIAFLIARNAGDTGDDPGVDVSDDPAATGEEDPAGPDANEDGLGTFETAAGRTVAVRLPGA